ncbi:Uncharacterised protein [Acinetobacter baumannii]|nr:Uncharacterised protein [Acinetobacter baumannii]
MRSWLNTQSGRTWPPRHWLRLSAGLLRLAAMCLPANWMDASLPLLKGM